MALHQSMSLSVHSSAQARLRLHPVSSLNSSRYMYISDYLTTQASYMQTPGVATPGQPLPDGRATVGQRRRETVD
jgi:hypothetical protein